MIRVHHLNASRSHRVLWLLEELGLAYEIVQYQRDPRTMLAPESLRKIHPLGKSPVVEEDERVLAESGAILELLTEKHGAGEHFSAADIQMSFPVEAAAARAGLDATRPNLARFLARIRERPAYRRAIERGGPLELLS